MSTIKPLGNKLIIKRKEQPSQTESGLYIPDTAKEKPLEAEVLFVGEGLKDEKGDIIPMSVKIGDTILIPKWAGTEFTFNNEEVVVLKEEEILAIIEN